MQRFQFDSPSLQKLMLTVCALCPMAVAGIFISMYYQMWKIAVESEEISGNERYSYNDCVQSFEGHQYINEKDNIDLVTDTQVLWKWVYLTNWVLYCVHAMLTFCLCMSCLPTKGGGSVMGGIGFYGHGLCCPFHLGVIIFTGICRYNKHGKMCAEQSSQI